MLHFEQVPHGQLPCAMLNSGDTRRLRWLTKPGGSAVIFHDDGRIVGFIAYGHPLKVLTMYIAWVHPDLRRGGVGKDLFRLLIELERPARLKAEAVTRAGWAYMQWAKTHFKVKTTITKSKGLLNADSRPTRRSRRR